MTICVFGASSTVLDKKYILSTEHLGERMAERGHDLVYGAGAAGVMGAVARGVDRKGGKTIGVAPSFLNVDGRLFDCTELVITDTMRERKAIMEERADAFIIAPGGTGTFEEFFEVLTLKQLDRHEKAIAIFNVDGYYDSLIEFFAHSVEEKFMRETCFSLFKVFDNEDELLDYLEDYEPEKHSAAERKYF